MKFSNQYAKAGSPTAESPMRALVAPSSAGKGDRFDDLQGRGVEAEDCDRLH